MTDYRFVLDTNELDDADVGLGAPFVNVERFTLDQSPLNDVGFGLGGDDASFKVIAQSSDAACGALTAQASGEVIITIVATAEAPLDEIIGQATADITHHATATSNLAGLSAAATANIDNPATGHATLGGAESAASAIVSHDANASASLGETSASAQAIVVITAQGATLIPAATITANGTVIPIGEGVMDAPLGSLVASASATVRTKGGTAGGLILQHIPPKPPTVKQEEPIEPEPIEPVREPQEVFALSYARFPSVRARAVGNVIWIAEKDDEEILMLV